MKSQHTTSGHGPRFHGDPARLRSPERIARLEVERVLSLCIGDLTITTVLDVGTGTGLFAEAFRKQGLQVTGVDVNPEMLKIARRKVRGATFKLAEAENLPAGDASFDLVFLGLVLHEADDPARALREAHRVAKQRVVVLEYPYIAEELGPPLVERMKSERIIELITAEKFREWERIELKRTELYRMAKGK